jgi:hypothetical protein
MSILKQYFSYLMKLLISQSIANEIVVHGYSFYFQNQMKNKHMKNVLIIAFALFIVACSSDATRPSVDEALTKKVLDHHVQTFQQNDLEGVMADYTEESVLVTPDKTYKGLSEIRENFVQAFEALPKDGTTMTVTKSVVVKDVAYIVWNAVTPTLNFKYATDTFIIVEGKILSQTFAGDIAPVTATPAN